MKLLYICFDFHPLNTGYANAFANALDVITQIPKIQVDVLTPIALGQQAERTWANTRIHRLACSGAPLRKALSMRQAVCALERQHRYDVMVLEAFDYAVLVWLLPQALCNKLLVRFHGTNDTEVTRYSKQLKFRVNRWIQDRAISKLCALSATNRHYLTFIQSELFLHNALAMARCQFFCLPNALPQQRPCTAPRVPNAVRRFIFLGRMDLHGYLQKGIADLLTALYLLKQQGIDIVMDIIGDGARLPSIRSFQHNHQLTQLQIHGALAHSQVAQLLHQADIVVLPSRFEGQSMFALEALSSGCAVIFSQGTALDDLVQGNGLQVPAGDPLALMQALQQMLSISDETLQRQQQASIDLSRHYHGAHLVSQWQAVLHSVSARGAIELTR